MTQAENRENEESLKTKTPDAASHQGFAAPGVRDERRPRGEPRPVGVERDGLDCVMRDGLQRAVHQKAHDVEARAEERSEQHPRLVALADEPDIRGGHNVHVPRQDQDDEAGSNESLHHGVLLRAAAEEQILGHSPQQPTHERNEGTGSEQSFVRLRSREENSTPQRKAEERKNNEA